MLYLGILFTLNAFIVPSSSPTNLTVIPLNSTSLRVSWSPPSTAERRGVLTSYSLTVTAANQELDTTKRDLELSAESSLSVDISGLEEYTLYSVALSASTSVGSGPVTVVTARTDESGNYTNISIFVVVSPCFLF